MSYDWLPQRQQVTWKHYVSVAVISFFIPFLAACIQSAWVMAWNNWSTRMTSASLLHVSDPLFWLEDATLGLLSFLILCLVIKIPLRRWIVMAALCIVYTYLMFLTHPDIYNPDGFK
jgi:hypothetical protein